MGQALTRPSARVLPSNKSHAHTKAAHTKAQRRSWRAKRAEAALVAHLGSRRQSVQLMKLHGHSTSHSLLLQAAISELTTDMETCREADPASFIADTSNLLEERAAPMLLLDAAVLAKRDKLPCFDEVEKKLVPLSSVSAKDIVVFISHRWFRPGVPDGDSAEKVRIVREIVDRDLLPKAPEGGRILLWWDYFSIAQKADSSIHMAVKGAQILAIPFYLAASDVLIALRGGDEEAYAADESEASTHSGFYDNRVWTMLELFGFTSDFAMQCHTRRASTPRTLVDCRLSYDADGKQLVATSVAIDGRFEAVRQQLHDTPGWTLPPGDNLTDKADLRFIEPMVIALATPRASDAERTSTSAGGSAFAGLPLARLLHTASTFGFEHAVSSFVSLLDEHSALAAQIDAPDDAGHTSLARAVFADKPTIVSALLAAGADVSREHPKLKTTALHVALSLDRRACARLLLEAHAVAGTPLPVDALGRSCLHLIAAACNASQKRAHASEDDARAFEEEELAGKGALMRRVIELGVSPTARDASGRTAIDLALSRNATATVGLIDAIMSDEQRAASMPRTLIRHDVDVPPAPKLADVSSGVFQPSSAEARGTSYTYTKWAPPAAPATDAASPAGPKVLLSFFLAPMAYADHAEELVRRFGASVWYLDFVPDSPPAGGFAPGTVTCGTAANVMAEFIEKVVDGGVVDMCVAWCKPGEVAMRVSAAKPHLIKSNLLVSTPAAPEDAHEAAAEAAMIKGAVDAMGCEGAARMMMPMMVSGDTLMSSKLAEPLIADMGAMLAKWLPHYDGEHSFMMQMASNSRYWRHWSTVEQPTLLLAGADDSAFLLGMENLASIVPNAAIEYAHGVSHMPQLENPKWYREHVARFLSEQGFAPRAE